VPVVIVAGVAFIVLWARGLPRASLRTALSTKATIFDGSALGIGCVRALGQPWWQFLALQPHLVVDGPSIHRLMRFRIWAKYITLRH
jgi:hypothetical protein